jgi:outer membrane protein insertion porin family
VQEKLTGSFNIGAGFSSIDSFVAFISLAQTNFDLFDWPRFRGAGQKFRVNVRYGNERRDAEISFVEPWFLEQRLALGVDLFYRDLYYLSDYYDQRNMGGAISLRWPAGENGFLRAAYRLQDVEIYDIAPKATPAIAGEEGSFLESRLSLEYVYDTRDNVFLPRKGLKFSAEAALMGGLLAGDVDNYSINLDYEQHWGLPLDTILTVRGQVGVVDGITSSDRVPIFNRFFLGGAQNMRGFDYRDVGPKDARGEPIGGQTLAALTVEYTFPIIPKVRGAVFYDVGFVNADPFDFSTNQLNSNVGLGLRLYLTSFPINLDFGYPIQTDDFNDSGGKFQFTVGFQY